MEIEKQQFLILTYFKKKLTDKNYDPRNTIWNEVATTTCGGNNDFFSVIVEGLVSDGLIERIPQTRISKKGLIFLTDYENTLFYNALPANGTYIPLSDIAKKLDFTIPYATEIMLRVKGVVYEDKSPNEGYGEPCYYISRQSITPAMPKETIPQKIFINHSSKDADLVEQFINNILILGLGLKSEEIFCTSYYGTDVKSGEDFKKAILNELTNAKMVLQIITSNYKASEVCLNEMGAAWVVSDKVVPLIAGPFNYDVGFIHATSQQLKLNNKDDIKKLYDDHQDIFTNRIKTVQFGKQIDVFVEYIERRQRELAQEKETRFFYNEENTIVGIIHTDIFGHPPITPGIGKIEDHRSFHRYYYLKLDAPIDVLSNELTIKEGNFNVSHFKISKVQIINTSKEVNLKELKNKKVAVTGNFWGWHTAWHQTEVMINGKEINLI
jgi:hypothetical protein